MTKEKEMKKIFARTILGIGVLSLLYLAVQPIAQEMGWEFIAQLIAAALFFISSALILWVLIIWAFEEFL